MKRRFLPPILILFFFIMLTKPQETFHGASEGLLLWFQTVLPTLLPFLIIANLLIRTNTMIYFSKLLAPMICPLFGISPNGAFAVLAGFLCGCPMGAKITADLICTNKISRKEGDYLLSFCNNTSPIFLMNYVVLKNLRHREFLLPSVAILFLAPVLCSFLFRPRKRKETAAKALPSGSPYIQIDDQILDETIMNGFETITKIGGYIMLFSVFLSLVQTLPIHSFFWENLLLPSLEITNGVSMICSARISFETKYILSMALVSFGGLCSAAQTQCMIQHTGLRITPYIIKKLATAAVTSLFALLYLKL